MNQNVEELISNRFELVDWVYKQVMARINQEIDERKQQLKNQDRKLQEKYEKLSSITQSLDGYRGQLSNKEKELEKIGLALNDRTDNLQRIYDKMLDIEKQLPEARMYPTEVPELDLSQDLSKFLPMRPVNALRNKGIFTLHDILQCTQRKLRKIEWFGEKSLTDIQALFSKHRMNIKP